MPNAKTQKYLGYIGAMGVLTACFGCGLAANNQMRAAQIFLLIAWLVLVPLFGYLLSTRRRMKQVVRVHSAQRQDELDALASAMHGGQVSGIGGRGPANILEEDEIQNIDRSEEDDGNE